MKPHFEETSCPRCGDSDGITTDDAVQLVITGDIDGYRTRVIWCEKGHVTAINHKGIVTVSGYIDDD